jgi:flavin-binding protein dodecin
MGKKRKGAKMAGKTQKPKSTEEMEVNDVDSTDEEEVVVAPRKKSTARASSSQEGSVYKIIEVVGSSSESWENAAQIAVQRASKTLDDLRIAEVVDQDLKIEDGEIVAYRTKLRLSFKFRD